MTAPGSDPLIDRLNRGDPAAAAELVAAYAPYLRAVARGHISTRLRAKFDSADVVQSVWVQVLRRLNADGMAVETEDELKALLATITRRRALNRVRHHTPAGGREDAAGGLDAVPAPGAARPSEEAQAGDLWARMFLLCPPEHHDILRLRRDGAAPAEIAAALGLHPGSVRRVLRRLAREVADQSFPFPDLPADAE